MVDALDLEGLADALYRETGNDPSTPIFTPRLGRMLLGVDAVQLVPKDSLRFKLAALTPWGAAWRIWVRRGLGAEATNFLCAHEIAHWAMRRERMRFETEAEEELAADYLGAALVAPRAGFRSALRAVGDAPPALAEALRCTQSLAVLRLGEITGRPLALVRPALVRVRGQLEFLWPEESTIRRWARGVAPKGLAKVTLTDGGAGRVALLVDELEVG